MRTFLFLLLGFVLVSSFSNADDVPIVIRARYDGENLKYTKNVDQGFNCMLALLKSCTYSDPTEYKGADFQKAQTGDHIRFAFSSAIKIEIRRVEISVKEVVFGSGSLWVLDKEGKVTRHAKYTFKENEAFRKWREDNLATVDK